MWGPVKASIDFIVFTLKANTIKSIFLIFFPQRVKKKQQGPRK